MKQHLSNYMASFGGVFSLKTIYKLSKTVLHFLILEARSFQNRVQSQSLSNIVFPGYIMEMATPTLVDTGE